MMKMKYKGGEGWKLRKLWRMRIWTAGQGEDSSSSRVQCPDSRKVRGQGTGKLKSQWG